MTPLATIPELQELHSGRSLIRLPSEQNVPFTPRVRAIVDTEEFQRLNGPPLGEIVERLRMTHKLPGTPADLLQKYTDTGYRGEEGFYANNWPTWRRQQDERRKRMISGEEPLDLSRSLEYGAWIIEAIEKDDPIEIHGNVAPNTGLIDNLMPDGCVEVACTVDRRGVTPGRVDRLPKQMAAICESNMRCFDLMADACLERSKSLAIQSLLLDPLTAAVCSPAEIRAMAEEMFEAEDEFLPGFG